MMPGLHSWAIIPVMMKLFCILILFFYHYNFCRLQIPGLPPSPPTMYTSHASSSILIPLDFIAINISAVYTPPYGDNGSVWVLWMWTTTTCHPLPPPPSPPFPCNQTNFWNSEAFFFLLSYNYSKYYLYSKSAKALDYLRSCLTWFLFSGHDC